MNSEPQISLIFKKKLDSQQLSLIEQIFKENNFSTIVTTDLNYQQSILLLTHTNGEELFKQAENVRILKIFEQFKPNSSKPSLKLYKRKQTAKIQAELDKVNPKIQQFEQRQMVSLSLANALLDQNQMEQNEQNYQILAKQMFTSAEMMRIVHSLALKVRIQDMNIIDYLKKNNILSKFIILHDDTPFNGSGEKIKDYYGEQIAMYFEFFKQFNKLLIYPTILGFIVSIIDWNNSGVYLTKASVVYSYFVILWISYLCINWQRKEASLSIEYGSYGKVMTLTDKRLDFKGQIKLNLVSGLPYEDYPNKKRIWLYVKSFLECLPILSISFFLKVIYLNLKGYCDSHNSSLYVQIIHDIKNGYFLSHIPGLQHIIDAFVVISIIVFNNMYDEISVQSTNRENHKTNESWNNSVIIKRVIFGVINRLSHIFFVAFAQLNIVNLRSEIISLFIFDNLFRVGFESFLPYITLKKKQKENEQKIEEFCKQNNVTKSIVNKIIQSDLDPYDIYSDYIEVIFQIMHLSVFACVFPAGSYLSFLINFVEKKSDMFKLENRLYQRAHPQKASGIGIWLILLKIISFLCLFSNFLFFTLKFYIFQEKELNDGQNEYTLDQNNLESNLVSVFAYEHITMLLLIIMHLSIQTKPYWVRVFLQRQNRKLT